MILGQNNKIEMLRKVVKFLRFVIVSVFIICFLLALYSSFYKLHRRRESNGLQRKQMVEGWEVNVSRNIRQYVLPGEVTSVININNLCRMDLFLIVIVCSAPTNFQQRSAIRDTWASLADNTVRVAFMLGVSHKSSLQTQIEQESRIYNDIIQDRFVDTYNNLTIKSVMILKWVQEYCSSARFLMKCDDDIYLNLPALSKALRTIFTKRKNILIGSLISGARPIQDSRSKWYTPRYIFNESYFPNYLSGTGYVLSFDVVPKLYRAALNTPVIHLEDIYITGICACVAGLKPLNHSGFFYLRRNLSDSCSPTVFNNHPMSPNDMRIAFSYAKNVPSLVLNYSSGTFLF